MLSAWVFVYSAVLTLRALWCWRQGGLRVAHIAREQREVAREWSAGPPPPTIQVVLFLPMLREQGNVRDLFEALNRLDFPAEHLLVVPITTERETADQADRTRAAQALLEDLEARRTGARFFWKHSRSFPVRKLSAWVKTFQRDEEGRREVRAALQSALEQPTTRECVERALAEGASRAPSFHVHFPGVRGNKATQMNHALDVLRERGVLAHPERTYIGVYDADSRPHPLSLASLALAAHKDLAPAFQQYPIYLKGAERLGPLMRNEAWLQTARSLCVEYPRQLEVNRALLQGRMAGRTFTYCIGHGEFLRADWLLRARFPELQPIDDLPTGYMLSLAGQRIVPLPFFDVCEVADSLPEFIHQTSTWFAGQSDYRDPPARAARHFGPIPLVRAVRGRVEQVLANVQWATLGLVRLGVLGACLLTGSWAAGLVVLMAFTLEAAVNWGLALRLVEGHLDAEHLPRLAYRWSSVARPLFSSVGPCTYLLRRLFAQELPRYKTER
ncbi:glycosyltransferase family 2 protein [Stigmatella sp. ncwal1]|uniref:Glycosyltransferase family 2 protein n=1 Tax=Stigmatella ashevillensis TaxID=2995309 RepID=A0ABT5DBT4_9BACT|nr:glycosyltransferase family 2 protein [Stigmatella ashevillena]MDC0710268.1 glycosyltransferase family 2 protein [Stigmatella ashevillena]